MSERVLAGLADRLERAERGAGAAVQAGRGAPSIRLAEILEIKADNVYKVALIRSDGSTGATVDGVQSIAAAPFVVGNLVQVSISPSRPIPLIVSGGGGGASGLNDWGVVAD